MVDSTRIPFNSEKLKINSSGRIMLSFMEFDAMSERYQNLEVRAGEWAPSVEEIEMLVKDKGIINSAQFLLWILETSEKINEAEYAKEKTCINRILRENMELCN